MIKRYLRNDFKLNISPKVNGVFVDLSNMNNVAVSVCNKRTGERFEPIWEFTPVGIELEITRENTKATGVYFVDISYRKPDVAYTDNYQDRAQEQAAFEIVPMSEAIDEADDSITIEMIEIMRGYPFTYADFTPEQIESLKVKGDPFTYDDFTPEQIAILKGEKGDPFLYSDLTPEQKAELKGEKGDAFEYSDFTPEQIALLQKPASDIATTVSNAEELRVTAETNRNNAEGLRLSAEIGRENAESNRVEAETARSSAETGRQTAEGLRVQAEIDRQTNTSTAISNANDAAILANEKAGLANEKALLANEKAGLAATATTQANDARDGANNAAQTANEAATNISPAVINNEQVQAETYNVLNARISALESLMANGIFTYLQANTLIGVNSMLYKGAEIFLYGTAAPNIAPDFIGQFYINTTAGTTYQAKGIANAADWKQISN